MFKNLIAALCMDLQDPRIPCHLTSFERGWYSAWFGWPMTTMRIIALVIIGVICFNRGETWPATFCLLALLVELILYPRKKQ